MTSQGTQVACRKQVKNEPLSSSSCRIILFFRRHIIIIVMYKKGHERFSVLFQSDAGIQRERVCAAA